MMEAITVKTREQIKEEVRQAVLGALDGYARGLLGHADARGWMDDELPVLFAGVDAHAKALTTRIYQGYEPGSATVMIAEAA